MNSKTRLIFTSLILFFNLIFAKVIFPKSDSLTTISGFIYDANSGETMIGANIFVAELENGTSSNVYGYYSVTIPKGIYTFHISFVGYQSIIEKVNLSESRKINFSLNQISYSLEEVIVSDDQSDENFKSTEMGSIDLVPKNIDRVPVLLGEKDILKTVQLLPGISSSGEGNSGFIVRGGTAEQNLILLDEAPVYNPSHLLGFFSVFNSDAIKNAKIIKGVSGSEYGGRLSSVLDINMKDGSNKGFNFYGGIGLISSRLTIEGPIVKDRGSFIVSGRRTYVDLFFPLFDDDELKNSAFYFYDLNVKLNYQLGEKDRLFLSAYTGRDIFNYNKEFGFDWGNTTGTLRWNHLFGEKLFSNSTLIYSEYNYDILLQDKKQSTRLNSGIRDINFKNDLQFYYSSNSTFRTGLNIIYHNFSPGSLIADGNSNYNTKRLNKYYAIESNLYFGHEWSFSSRIKINYGIRFSNFTLLGPANVYSFDDDGYVSKVDSIKSGVIIKSFNHLEPRFSANYLLDETSSVKIGYARNTQNIHLLSTTTTSTPLDIWQPSTSIIEPEISDLISLGYFRNFSDNNYSASVEVYYKNMHNLIEYKNGADIFLNEFVESQLVFGKGWSYGIELFFEKKVGKFTGWLSYTLSNTKRQFDEINNGKAFNARQDRTHDIAIVGIYDISSRWTLSANWIYYSGLAATYPAGKYFVAGYTVNLYTDRNAQRMPDYHRLDIGATYYFKKSTDQEMSISFSLYNAYGRKNAYTISFEESEADPNVMQAVKLSLFSVVPSLSFNFRF